MACRLLFGREDRRVRRCLRRSIVQVTGAGLAVGTTVLVESIYSRRVPRHVLDLARIKEDVAGPVLRAGGWIRTLISDPETQQALAVGTVAWLMTLWMTRWMERGNRLFPALLERSFDLGLPLWLVGCSLARPTLALGLTLLHLLFGIFYRRPTPSRHLQSRY